jgi:hypothetical protein
MPNVKDPSHYPGAKTIPQFCKNRMSPASYYKMRRMGNGPREFRVPGIRLVLITAKAEAEWEKRMASRSAQATVKREFERRSQQATMAGRLAAKSPLHVSQRRKRESTEVA